MYPNLFIHSTVNGCLGCFTFWLLWIMLLWTLVYKKQSQFLPSFLLDKYPEVELLDHMVVLFLVFWGTSILLFMTAVPVYIPTNSAQGFLFSTSSPTFIFLIYKSHCNRCEVVSPCGSDLHFPGSEWYWASFYVPIDHLYASFREMST